MRDEVEGRAGPSRLRYVLALGLAVALGLGVAVPVFAAEGPADGGTIQPQVVGGEPVPDGRHRFMASLQDITRGNSAYRRHYCGGTLIDRNSVLTAAHCVEGVTAVQLRVIVGRTKLDSSEGQRRAVAGIARHPRYTSSLVSFRFDAAVLRLSSRVNNIRPVHIPKSSSNKLEEPGRLLTIAGWGNTIKQSPDGDEPNNKPRRMQEARVSVVSERRAQEAYDGYVPRIMVAAGREGKDACQGDSGGPMFRKKDDGRVVQVGITSFGVGCGAQGYPGVYAEANSPGIRPFIVRAANN